jgi:hypothetical protein
MPFLNQRCQLIDGDRLIALWLHVGLELEVGHKEELYHVC